MRLKEYWESVALELYGAPLTEEKLEKARPVAEARFKKLLEENPLAHRVTTPKKRNPKLYRQMAEPMTLDDVERAIHDIGLRLGRLEDMHGLKGE